MNISEQNGNIDNGKNIDIVLAVCSIHMASECMDALIKLLMTNSIGAYITTRISLLPQARNEMVRKAYEYNPKFTHLLFIDDDMSNYSLDHVIKLIEADKPVISAFVTMRMPPYRLVNSFHGDSSEDIIKYIQEEQIKETKHVGMAFTLIKREVLEDVCEMTEDGPIWFTTDRDERNTFEQELKLKHDEWMEKLNKKRNKFDTYTEALKYEDFSEILEEAVIFGQQAHIGSMMLGEDITFSRRAIRCEYKLYIHCGCIVGHVGNRSFNVRDALKRRVEDEFEKNYEGEKLCLASELAS